MSRISGARLKAVFFVSGFSLCLNHFDKDVLWENPFGFMTLPSSMHAVRPFRPRLYLYLLSFQNPISEFFGCLGEESWGFLWISNYFSGKLREAEPAALSCSDVI